ncbi:MAG TPA: sugar phosphate isomerase/epimerase family protein [Bryobacteraceae bacterium]|nr:sugar phosphate isomerase/epimerase family protein [Bryobacteraceae bacterium]
MDSTTRRDFARSAALAGTMALAGGQAGAAPNRPPLCLFSKHLPKLNYSELARTVKQMGFDGVDLTVRPEGHVLPGRVTEDLPRAVETLRGAGLVVPMITTGLISANDPAARPTIETAGRLGVPRFKLGYWNYRDQESIDARLGQVRGDVTGLVALAKEHGVTAGYHNHSGNYVGAAVWDTRAIIGDMDSRAIGYYFDPCHATAEGGEGGWRIAMRMALPRIQMVAIKDFVWEKSGGKWKMQMCPLGEGMVRWAEFFGMLAAARFQGPVSMHAEYEPVDEAALARDLAFLKKQVDAAYRGV